MFFTTRRIYRDFVLDGENGLKCFYEQCTKRQKIFCWASLACAISLIIVTVLLARNLTPWQNLIVLSASLLVIVVFEGFRSRLERKFEKRHKTYSFILMAAVATCAVATGAGMMLLFQLYRMM